MTVTKLSEIAGMEDDQTIYSIKGVIKKIWKFRAGESAQGPWSFQDVILNDGTEGCVTLKNRPELPASWVGQSVYFLAYHGDKGWSGLRVKHDDHKKKNVILATPTAEMVSSAAHEAGHPEAGQAAPAAPAPRSVAPPPPLPQASLPNMPAPPPPPHAVPHQVAPPAPPVRPTTYAGIAAAKQFLGREANLMLLALDATVYVAHCFEKKHGAPLPAAHLQACCASLFIAADRASLADMLPIGPMNGFATAPPAKPKEPEAGPNTDYNAEIGF
jgi:hypothetical protein